MISSVPDQVLACVKLVTIMLGYTVLTVDVSSPALFFHGLRSSVRAAGCDSRDTVVMFKVITLFVFFLGSRFGFVHTVIRSSWKLFGSAGMFLCEYFVLCNCNEFTQQFAWDLYVAPVSSDNSEYSYYFSIIQVARRESQLRAVCVLHSFCSY